MYAGEGFGAEGAGGSSRSAGASGPVSDTRDKGRPTIVIIILPLWELPNEVLQLVAQILIVVGRVAHVTVKVEVPANQCGIY